MFKVDENSASFIKFIGDDAETLVKAGNLSETRMQSLLLAGIDKLLGGTLKPARRAYFYYLLISHCQAEFDKLKTEITKR